MKFAAVSGNVFSRPHRHAIDRMRQANATVHGLKTQLAIDLFTQHHHTRTAITLAATFFGRRAAQVLTQHLQQGAAGRHIVQTHKVTTLKKAKRPAVGGR